MAWTIEEAREFIKEIDFSGVPLIREVRINWWGAGFEITVQTKPVVCINTGELLPDGLFNTTVIPVLNEHVILTKIKLALTSLVTHEFEEQLRDRDGHYFFDPHNERRRALRRRAIIYHGLSGKT